MNSKVKDKQEILDKIAAYYKNHMAQKDDFVQGERIPYAARLFDEQEMTMLAEAGLDFWLTAGSRTIDFEQKLGAYLGAEHVLFVNSGSSANLIAFGALCSHKLSKRRIMPGDEVITVAAGFPTTITPIIQYGAIPVFVDVTIPEYNVDISALKAAINKKTKAVFLAHTMGSPFDIVAIKALCDKHDLWLIEDNCDSLGATVDINKKAMLTGTIGDIGTSSFYPPHHITTGEGGAVYTNNSELAQIMGSLRDWGRDCTCKPGQDNSCGNRLSGQHGKLPFGYDHKYVFSQFGYNLKATDMQAAIGIAQLDKLSGFVQKRRQNWDKLFDGLKGLSDTLILPKTIKGTNHSPFGFIITLKASDKLTRKGMIDFLEAHNIQTRMLFAGNIIMHPCFDEMRQNKKGYRVVGRLTNTNNIMNQTFWVGVYPGLGQKQLDYIINMITEYVKTHG